MKSLIKKINIHALRGITDLSIPTDKKSVIIYGENGTGKSSIVDALDFFFTGDVFCLKGVKTLSINRHCSHINYSNDDMHVEVVFTPSTSLIRDNKDKPSPPSQLKPEDFEQLQSLDVSDHLVNSIGHSTT